MINPFLCDKNCSNCIWFGLDCEGKIELRPLVKSRASRIVNYSDSTKKLLSECGKLSWETRSEEQKKKIIQNLNQSRKRAWNDMSPEQRQAFGNMISNIRRKEWEKKSVQEKGDKTKQLIEGKRLWWQAKSPEERKRIIDLLIKKRSQKFAAEE
jgi:hypothetical protein